MVSGLAECVRRTLEDRDVRQPIILVVEDEVLIRFAISDYLRDAGFRVVEARDGNEAIELLNANSRISLVFTDLRMPGDVDGKALVQWIAHARPELPVVVASGISSHRLAPNFS
jgi:DNA-binding NtrC family response regulator